MTAWTDFLRDDEPFGQPGVCTRCGDDSPNVDEATELCEMCFEHTFGIDPKEPEQ